MLILLFIIIWNKPPEKSDGNQFFLVPDAQYDIRLSGLGKLDRIIVHKDHRALRQWVGRKKYAKPGQEQPISYYQNFYSGSKEFSYNEKGRIIGFLDSTTFKDAEKRSFGKEFDYDDSGGIYQKLEGTEFIFNDSAQLVCTIKGDESNGYYKKQNFKYDNEGRIIYREEFGYNFELDEEENLVFFFEKGILLMFSCTYLYVEITPGITHCQKDLTVEYDNPKKHRKTLISYDSHGYKTFHEYYSFDGSLYERDEYHFEFDDRGNWIRMIKDIRFGNGQENKKQPLIEREIHYSDGMITGIWEKSASFPALASISESMIDKIKRYFLRF